MADEIRNDEDVRTLLQVGADVARLVEDLVTRSTALANVIQEKVDPHFTEVLGLAQRGAEADKLEWKNEQGNPLVVLDEGVCGVRLRVLCLHEALGELRVNMKLLDERMHKTRSLLDHEDARLETQDLNKKQRRG